MSVFVSDNSVRANGALGSNWATPVPNHAEFQPWTGTAAGNILINGNGFGPDAANGLDCCVLWAGAGAGSFGNNQWASATIKTLAANTATLSITAVSGSGSTWTYTYTVTQGSVANAVSGGALYVVISGLQNAGNNGHFTPTTFGSGTFTVTNASGVAESGSTGTGNCPSDSGAGVMVRGSGTSIATLNGYFFHAGTNSFSGDGRKYYIELWKVVNGVGTYFGTASNQPTTATTVIKVGDTIGISAVGTTITAYVNGVVYGVAQTDSDITSGTPGLWSFAVSGANEYVFSKWNDGGSTQFGGNNGTTLNNFQAGDITNGANPRFDPFVGTNGDLHTYNSNWVENLGTFNISGNTVGGNSYVGSNALASWQGASFGNDQWAQLTLTGGRDIGVAVRVSASGNTGYFYRGNGANTRVLYKVVAGSYTLLATSNTSHSNVAGDIRRSVVIGTNLYCFLNGVLENFGVISDNAIASGFPGIQSDTDIGNSHGAPFAAGNVTMGGNAGVASASMALTGAATATVTADGSGNYNFASLADGSYTITPTLAGQTFSPASISWTLVGGVIYPTGLNFTATQLQVATPTFSPIAGTYSSAQTVTVSSTDSGLAGFAMYYTTDGSTPTTGSTPIANGGTISVPTTTTIKVLAVATGYINSAIASATYTILASPGGKGLGFNFDLTF